MGMLMSNQYDTYNPFGGGQPMQAPMQAPMQSTQPGQLSQSSQPDIDQEMAMEELRERYAHGTIDIEEFQRLIGLVMVTTDPRELQAIIDQAPPDPAAHRAVVASRSGGLAASASARRAARPINAFFGEVDRSRHFWELGAETEVNATFGEVNLDIRMARMSEGPHVLRLNALFGEINVTVPRGMYVTVDSTARFGEVNAPGHEIGGILARDELSLGAEGAGGISLHIEATATFGEINIRTA